MCKALIYAANTATQTVASNAEINFGNIVRKYGNGIAMKKEGIEIKDCGFYNVVVDLSFTGSGTGDEVIQIYYDGLPVTGAAAKLTVAASTSYNVTIPTVVRKIGCREDDGILTVESNGVALNVANATISVVKL